jgi:gamma-glutamyltranspeptidase / glutathione hydrolase
MNSIDWQMPYASQRMPVLARNVVATTQPLAAQAGLRMLLQGGNAVDAALAAAIAAAVVEPCSNGIGSDAFALVWDGQHLHGLNGSGRSPQTWRPERFAGLSSMPVTGWDSVSVPGAVSAWTELSRRFGKLPFERLFIPAIEYAREGFLVAPIIARQWGAQAELLAGEPGFASAFLRHGKAPAAGELFKFAHQADTLEQIAATHGEAFYRGQLAERMVADSERHGGALSAADLGSHRALWVEPIEHDYRGDTVHELPPNGQGLAALIALGILEQLDMGRLGVDTAESLHAQIEAMKLAFADVYEHVADPEAMRVGCHEFLSPAYLARRAALINMDRAQWPGSGLPRSEGTVYLTAADASGMMVSFIQSNFRGFGSGVVVENTGISLNDRASAFSLQPGHPNVVAGGKLPFHTIIPAFQTRAGRPLMSFGVMGGDMQPQGHVQMIVRLTDYGQNVQAAADAPRWKVIDNQRCVMVEPGFDASVLEGLQARGHRVQLAPRDSTDFGAAQLIQCLDQGYVAASERRRDGQAVGF